MRSAIAGPAGPGRYATWHSIAVSEPTDGGLADAIIPRMAILQRTFEIGHAVAVRRVSVVGNAGSGKTLLARHLAETLGVPHIELDAIHHLPGWEPLDADTFLAEVQALASADGWVIDGNYRAVVVDGPVWRRADTIVWIDLPRYIVMYQVISRTLRRVVHREELWNGNREPLRNLYSWDPYKSIIRWSWTQHSKYKQRFSAAMRSPLHGHLEFVRLTSRAEIGRWLDAMDESSHR